MRIILRVFVLLCMPFFCVAESGSSPTLWQSLQVFLGDTREGAFSEKTNSSGKFSHTALPDEGESPSLGVWGMLDRFFRSKTAPTAQEPLKTTTTVEQKTPDQGLPETAPKRVHADVIVPHKAKYTITLEKNYGDDISDAAGEMTINVYDTGDGLVFEQNSTLIIYNGDGEGEQIITNLATWQDYEGKRYRFNSRTVRNGEQEEIIKGEALKDDFAHLTRITYTRPAESQVTTPYETLFPLHHLIHALEMAKAGKSVVSDIVFDGSSETHEAVSVDTLLGAPKPSGLKIKTDQAISTQTQWPMRLAVYAFGSTNPEPDYEMVQNVLDCGVIKDMTLDYGAFQVKATLEKIDFYEPGK
jgi:EipB-like